MSNYNYSEPEWCGNDYCTAPIVHGVPLCNHRQENYVIMNTPKPQASKPLAFTPPIHKLDSAFRPIKNDGKNRPLADHPGLAKLRESK